MMQITINGETRKLPDGATVAALLEELGVDSMHVAIERNHELVPRRTHAVTILAEGDCLEIVTLVGGG